MRATLRRASLPTRTATALLGFWYAVKIRCSFARGHAQEAVAHARQGDEEGGGGDIGVYRPPAAAPAP